MECLQYLSNRTPWIWEGTVSEKTAQSQSEHPQMTSELLRFRQLVIRYRCREERSGLLRIRCGGITPTAESANPCPRIELFWIGFNLPRVLLWYDVGSPEGLAIFNIYIGYVQSLVWDDCFHWLRASIVTKAHRVPKMSSSPWTKKLRVQCCSGCRNAFRHVQTHISLRIGCSKGSLPAAHWSRALPTSPDHARSSSLRESFLSVPATAKWTTCPPVHEILLHQEGNAGRYWLEA